MSDDQVPAKIPAQQPESTNGEPEVRLELTNAGVRQVWALYSQERAAAGGLPPVGDEDDPLSLFLRELPGLAWRGRWYLLACVALSVALGVFYLNEATPVFNVGAQVLIERRPSPLEDGVPVRDWTLATQAEIMQSPAILRAAVDAVGTNDGEPSQAAVAEEAKLPLLWATPIVGTNVIAVSYRTSDPVKGAQLVESVIERYAAYARDLEQTAPREALELMRRKEQELRGQLGELERAYQGLRGQSQSFGEGRDALSVQKAVLERQAQMLVEARSHRIELENRLQATRWAESRGDGHSANAVAQSIREELWRAELRAAELTRNYSDQHPDVQAIQSQIATLKRQLAASSRVDTSALESQLRAARGTEQRLVEAYERELQRSIELDSHRLKEEELLGDMRRVSAIHETALGKLKELELRYEALSQGGAGILIRVLDGPSPSASQVWPQPVLVLLPCGLLGLMAGLVIAAMAEHPRRSRARSVLARAPGMTAEPYPAKLDAT